ncbi:MAG: ABC transporter ATP-binding protein [Leptospirales bacterium]
MITFKNVTKTFNGKNAIKNISFNIQQGKATAIIGPNGSGKTTIINLILGFLKADSGDVLFQEESAWGNRTNVNRQIGVVQENPSFYPSMSAEQNLKFFAQLFEVSEDNIPRVLKATGMDKHPDKRFSQYSMGMKQRLNISYSMLHDPEIYIFDEPTNGLDPVGIADIREIIQKFVQDGKTVILCSHLLAEVEKICQEVIIVKNGLLIEDTDITKDITKKYDFELKYDNMEKLISAIKSIPEITLKKNTGDQCLVQINKKYDGSFINEKLAQKKIYVSEIILIDNFESTILEKMGEN